MIDKELYCPYPYAIATLEAENARVNDRFSIWGILGRSKEKTLLQDATRLMIKTVTTNTSILT